VNDWDENTKLSKNFTIREFVKSQTAKRKEIDNSIQDEKILNNLINLCENVVQPIRDHYKIAFSPNSGFRSLSLNRLLGSKDTSQHVLGQAVDLEIPRVNNQDLFDYVRKELNFDQVILEYYDGVNPSSGWVHISYVSDKDNRNRAMTFDGTHYRIVEE